MKFPELPRYVVGAILFGLIWATIAYTQQGVRDFGVLATGVLVIIVFGVAMGWGLRKAIIWFRTRR
jgi:hypothetical protein